MTDTSPLHQWTIDEAVEAQFRLVDLFHRQFDGLEAVSAGDFGSPRELGRPRATAKVERVIADFFRADDAVLVPAAGTGAIRCSLMAVLQPGARVLAHAAPMYATTAVTFRAMGIHKIEADFNRKEQFEQALASDPDMVYVQHTRQRLDDSYDVTVVIEAARRLAPRAVILLDDNYAAMQVPRIGVELGADLSAFSLFKLLGEPGVGCVVGEAGMIGRIRDDNYSGGSKIQGPVAVTTLKGMVYAPVALAVQAGVVEEVVRRLNEGELAAVHRAYVANHQERAALVEFDEPIAERVIDAAVAFGAAPYPVGSQSKIEVSVMVYRLSRAMCEDDPERARRMIRVNPNRTGADTILRVLSEAVAAVGQG